MEVGKLREQVQRLVDAGVPEEEVGKFIKRHTNPTAVQDYYSSVDTKQAQLSTEYPVRREISRAVRGGLEGIGLVGGGLIGGAGGTAAAPGVGTAAGAVAGAGLGYSIGSNIADRVHESLGLSRKLTLSESTVRAIDKVAEGATYEMGGQSITAVGAKVYGGFLKVFRWVRNKMPKVSDQFILQKAQDVYENLALESPAALTNAKETDALLRRLDIKSVPSQAQRTGSVTAANVEQTLASKNPDLAARMKYQDAQIRGEGVDKINSLFNTGRSAEDVLLGVTKQRESLVGQSSSAEKMAQRGIDPLFTGRRPQTVGQEIFDSLRAGKSEAKAVVDTAYKEIPEGVSVSGAPMKSTVVAMTKDFRVKGGGSGSYPKELVRDIAAANKRGGGNITFDQLKDFRSRIGEEIRDEVVKQNPNMKLVRRLRMLEDGVDDSMDQLLSSGDAAVVEKYREASSLFKQYAQTWRKGSVGDVLRSGQQSAGQRIAFSEIPNRFFRTGKMDAADDLVRAVGQEKAAVLIDDYAAFNLVSKAGDGGTLHAGRGAKWLQTNADVLKKYGLYDKYAGIVKNKEISDAITSELKAYEKSVASRILGVDVDDIVGSVFAGGGRARSASIMKDVLSLPGIAGDVAATNGLKTAFKDHILRKIEMSGVDVANKPLHSIKKVKDIIDDYMPAMKVLYKNDPAKIQALKDYHQLLLLLSRNKNVSYAGGSTTAEKLAGLQAETRQKIFRNMTQLAAIRVGKGWFFSSLRNLAAAIADAPKKFTEAQVEALLTEAIYSPDVASAIMKATRPYSAAKDVAGRELWHHMVTLGIGSAVGGDNPEEVVAK